jgi:signal transduction histidine kinase
MRSVDQEVALVSHLPAVTTILDVVCRITGMGFAAVARVTKDQWIACGVLDQIDFGLQPGGELKVETTICNEVRDLRDAIVIDDTATDAVYCSHPTPTMYGFRSYISVPIVLADGNFFGTLCAIDPQPRRLKTPETVGMFRLFAELIGFHLDAHIRVSLSEARLSEERETAQLREQFIAVLGHDLRNPLAAVLSGAQLMQRLDLGEQPARTARMIHASAARMSELVDDVLDFARGRLGGGIHLNRDSSQSLQLTLDQVVAELRAGSPYRVIHTAYDLVEPVNCDRRRIAQLLSNLLANALAHGDDKDPVQVGASSRDGVFELWVSNSGEAIPAEVMEQLFLPFRRGETKPNRQGLGLGLYIARQIAWAHNGKLVAESTPEATRFTLRMPTSGGDSEKEIPLQQFD